MVPTLISLYIPCNSLVLYGVFAHVSSANKQVTLEKSTVREMLDRKLVPPIYLNCLMSWNICDLLNVSYIRKIFKHVKHNQIYP